MLAKSKLYSIETLVSQTLIDMEINHKKRKKKNERKFEECKWKTRKIETDQCEFKNNTEFVTDDFNWLKNVSLKKIIKWNTTKTY